MSEACVDIDGRKYVLEVQEEQLRARRPGDLITAVIKTVVTPRRGEASGSEGS